MLLSRSSAPRHPYSVRNKLLLPRPIRQSMELPFTGIGSLVGWLAVRLVILQLMNTQPFPLAAPIQYNYPTNGRQVGGSHHLYYRRRAMGDIVVRGFRNPGIVVNSGEF